MFKYIVTGKGFILFTVYILALRKAVRMISVYKIFEAHFQNFRTVKKVWSHEVILGKNILQA